MTFIRESTVQLFVNSRILILMVLAAGTAGCFGDKPEDLISKSGARLVVSSSAFQSGQTIPNQYTADGGNRSPDIGWTSVPADAKSIAMIVDDTDANGYVHWVIYNLPPGTTKLPSGLPRAGDLPSLGQALQGQNSHGEPGYFGPQPPPGRPHHYHFRVYAIDEVLPLKAGASKDEVVKAMASHVIAQGELVGVFQSG